MDFILIFIKLTVIEKFGFLAVAMMGESRNHEKLKINKNKWNRPRVLFETKKKCSNKSLCKD